MPIYTRVGDGGFTQLPRKGQGPLRLAKNDPRVAALGELDEFNAHVGWCLAACVGGCNDAVQAALEPVQADLFRIGASLASLFAGGDAPVRLELTEVVAMEKTIDRIFDSLPPLTHFLLPGGGELASRLHVARTVCRRAERAVVAALRDMAAPAAPAVGRANPDSVGAWPTLQDDPLAAAESNDVLITAQPPAELIPRYLNRLSDLFFALSRQANRDDGVSERIWQP